VDGSGKGYLRTVCDYVHLNPARAKLLKPEQPLRAYRWSSFAEFLESPRQRPAWLRADRLFGELGIPKDSSAGREQFEQRVEDRRRTDVPGQWKAVRRGWCMGEEQFRTELLEQMIGKMGRHHGGSERAETAEATAECIVTEELKRRGWSVAELERRRKGDAEKVQVAQRLRSETTMTWNWIAARLHMGAAGYAANCSRAV